MADNQNTGNEPIYQLTDLQEKFCMEFVKDFRPELAAKRAGYSPNSAAEIAYQLRKDEGVKTRIRELQKEQREAFHITLDRWLMETAQIAFFNSSDLFDTFREKIKEGKGGAVTFTFEDFLLIPREYMANVKSVKFMKDGVHLYFYDRLTALEMLGRNLGAYELDNKQKEQPSGVSVYLPDNGRGDAQLPAQSPEGAE